MKRSLTYLLGVILATVDLSRAQCNTDSFVNTCTHQLGPGFNFLKGYKVDGVKNEGKVEYSYVFTAGTEYMVNLCLNGNTNDGVVVSLFDAGRGIVASSKINNQYVTALQFSCSRSGIYYIQYTFEGESRCAGSALGFKR